MVCIYGYLWFIYGSYGIYIYYIYTCILDGIDEPTHNCRDHRVPPVIENLSTEALAGAHLLLRVRGVLQRILFSSP